MPSGLKLWGIMTATAIVLSDDSPTLVKAAARLAKLVFHDRIQICDGVADDVEIQAAIDTLPTTGGTGAPLYLGVGGEIKLYGTYHISDTIIIRRPHVTISGVNTRGTVLILDNGVNKDVIDMLPAGVLGGNQCLLRDFTVDGNKDNQTAGGCIRTLNTGSADVMMSHIYAILGHDFGIYWMSGNGLADSVYVEGCDSYGWRIENSTQYCMFTNCSAWMNEGYGFYIDARFANNTKFVNCHASGSTLDDYYIANSWVDEGQLALIGCDSWGAKQHGIHLHDCRYVIVNGCIIAGSSQEITNTYSGIYLDSAHDLRPCKHNVITNNVIVTDSKLGNVPKYGIEEDGAFPTRIGYNIITNNQIQPTMGTAPMYIVGGHDKVYDQHSDLFMDVLAASATHLLNAQDVSAYTGGETPAIAAQPDVPRNITVTAFDNAAGAPVLTMTVIITGVDAKGNAVMETFETSGSETKVGNVAFATVSQIEVDVIAGNGAGDTLSVGIGSKLGLSNIIYATADVYKCTKNGADYSGAGNITPDATYDTVDVSTGAVIVSGDDFRIMFRSNLNIVS